MAKAVYIAEKPSVAAEFAKALKLNTRRGNGCMEAEDAIVTWCVGHLVGMSYPDAYDPKLKKWTYETLPFIPDQFLYEVLSGVEKQYNIVKEILIREDVDRIYVCTDSGREGEYIYRLVEQMVARDCPQLLKKDRRRVWIDSQTEEEILRGIREAKPLQDYDHLSDAAYLRAKEDYLMGINFSRVLTLKYGNAMARFLDQKYTVIAVGRVMTCVLGMIVRREREIRSFVKTPFYRVLAEISLGEGHLEAEWRAVEGSRYFGTPVLYKENGFKKREDAQELIRFLEDPPPVLATVVSKENKTEKKQPPLLFNLAELQNQCSKSFKISPDETLRITQELYEKKMVTYPRTDARVLSTAVSKEIQKNLKGLLGIGAIAPVVEEILQGEKYKGLAKTKYVNDKQITDHYAIIPTGQGLSNLKQMNGLAAKVYSTIVRRFLAIFLPPAVYKKVGIVFDIHGEKLFSSTRVLAEEGYLKVYNIAGTTSGKGSSGTEEHSGTSQEKRETGTAENSVNPPGKNQGGQEEEDSQEEQDTTVSFEQLNTLKKGNQLPVNKLFIKEGETTPPKRYNSGSLILAMENAGQLIEDEELRAQIKGSGIGTSATRAEILKKLVNNHYIRLNQKTQVISPDLLGEMVYDVVNLSIQSLLNPELTASWEKGLNYVAEGSIGEQEYMEKLDAFVRRRVTLVTRQNNQRQLDGYFRQAAGFYGK